MSRARCPSPCAPSGGGYCTGSGSPPLSGFPLDHSILPLFIGGDFVAADAQAIRTRQNPSDPSDILGVAPVAIAERASDLADARYHVGNWFAPITVRFASADDPLARRELFGPVLGVLRADSLDDAVALANDTPFGLSASLFTRDLSAAMRYVRSIEAGLVRVNGDTTGVDPHAPFGGMKSSSAGGREQGRAAREFYTETRTIQIHP